MLTITEIKATRSNLSQYFDNTRLSDDKRQRLFDAAGALARKYHDTQAAMLIRLESPFPSRVLDIVVFWAALLFLGDGLLALPNVVTVCAHLAGALGGAGYSFSQKRKDSEVSKKAASKLLSRETRNSGVSEKQAWLPEILFDHLVGSGQKRRREFEFKRVCGRKIDDELKISRLLDRHIGRVRALRDPDQLVVQPFSHL
jgi:hypothetical protein